jgi:pterin-4a-carbinolamine dehydratase
MNLEDKMLVGEAEIQRTVEGLDGWRYDADSRTLIRKWAFDKYVPTMVFIRKLTEVMDRENHHSDLALDGRTKTLTVKVTTFSEDAVTQADLDFAKSVSELQMQLG